MAKTLAVRDFMSATLVTFSPRDSLLDAIAALAEKRISGAPVIDELGNIVGILSERDCLQATITASYHGEEAGTVGEFMVRDVETVDADASVLDVAQLFLKKPYRRFPVVYENRLVGVISRRDALRALLSMHRAY